MFRICTMAALAIGIVATGPYRVEAQLPLTITLGPTISSISSVEYQTGSMVGFFVAAGTSFQLNDRISVNPQLGFAMKGGEFDGTDGRYDYIQIPVLFGMSTPLGESNRSVRFGLGPQIGFQTKCDEEGFDCTEFTDHKGTELGLVGNAAVVFPMSGGADMSVGLGFDLGLTNLFEVDYKTRTIQLFGSYRTSVGG